MLGVTDGELAVLKSIFAPYQSAYRFECYGSRVKGGFEKTSDLDVMITGADAVPFDVLDEIKQKCDDSVLPYIVNFCDRRRVSESFYESVKNDLTAL